MSRAKSATVKVTDVRPKRPKVDRGEDFEQLVRQMFKKSVDIWCKDSLDEMPDKETRGNVVDNLAASFTSSIETVVEAATDSYLSTVSDDDGEDDEDDADADGDGDEGDEAEDD